ncbi:MAG: polyprenyl synthetase family protein [Bernardetiaceae bacterium]|nr:polyprenyl synthetase family protein [Bernardetiaceae bacterium]
MQNYLPHLDLRLLPDDIEKALAEYHFGTQPQELYEPIRYILDLGGKRMRPVLTLLAYALFDDEWREHAMPAALAVEVFHNFTLLHDDIMDNAPLRRGKETVHTKWNTNIALLSGDVMLIKAYQLLLDTNSERCIELLTRFNLMATALCEGQQKDMNFETQQQVSIQDYLDMIKQKTAVLLGFCMEAGAILAGATAEIVDELGAFGVEIGIGFQLKDDYLDVYGDPSVFGKRCGGDILEAKKTYLLLYALEQANPEQKQTLEQALQDHTIADEEKIERVRNIYNELEAGKACENLSESYFEMAHQRLERMPLLPARKTPLNTYIQMLRARLK